MARYKLTLAYDGTRFFGSQRQANHRTVQEVLEAALRKLGWDGSSILLSGRTDSGVHATGQVASFDLNWNHSNDDLLRAINSSLPKDISVKYVQLVQHKFHPRFDALFRRYQYRIFCQPTRDPIREHFLWRVWPRLRSDLLRAAAEQLIGSHDFRAFGSPTTPKGSTVRNVTQATWHQIREDEWLFDVQANAFLYHMVRRIVFVQVAIAQEKLPVETITRALANQAPVEEGSLSQRGLAPPHGLILVEVGYGQ